MFGGFMTGLQEYVLWGLLVTAAATDLIWGKIYNLLTFTLIFVGFFARFYWGGFPELSTGLFALLGIFAVFFPLYWIQALAAGDVKLLMAVAVWSSFLFALRLGALAIVLGALVGVLVMVRAKGLRGAWQSTLAHVKFSPHRSQLSTKIPFAPAFLCALLIFKMVEVAQWHWLPF